MEVLKIDSIKELYIKMAQAMGLRLYRWNNRKIPFVELGHFVSIKGLRFQNAETRLLIVGRATNGWGSLLDGSDFEYSPEIFGELAYQSYQSESGFSWVKDENGVLTDGSNYRLSKSPFWRVIHNIWNQLSEYEEERWIENIAWTNLYKVAPNPMENELDTNANPTKTMMKAQFPFCKKILEKEISDYNPTHILFITGEWWACNEERDFLKDFISIKKRVDNHYVVSLGETIATHIPVVIANRPEYKDEQMYVKQIMELFSSY